MIKKLKWYGKSGIDPTWRKPPPDDFNDYRQYIFDHTSFAKIMRDYKLRVEECSTAKYTHKMVCPFKFHKNGRERTGSFRFNDKKKTFTCFGCTEGGDILKFLQLYCGGDEQYNLQRLAKMAGLIEDGQIQVPHDYKEPEVAPIVETNYKTLFDAGLLLRQYLLDIKNVNKEIYPKECEWVDQMLMKIDKYFNTIDEENIQDAQKIYNNLFSSLRKRRTKKGL